MKPLFLLSLVLSMFGTNSFAEDCRYANNNSLIQAKLLCKKMIHKHSHRRDCLDIVNEAIYFDGEAVAYCNNGTYVARDASIVKCMAAAANKAYFGTAKSCVQLIRARWGWAQPVDVINCLSDTGSTVFSDAKGRLMTCRN